MDQAQTLAELLAKLRPLLPETGPLTKRDTSRLRPVLEDMLEHFVLAKPDEALKQLDWQGRVNIALLNSGVQDLYLHSADFDENKVEGNLTVTAVWTFPNLKSSTIVEIFFSGAPT